MSEKRDAAVDRAVDLPNSTCRLISWANGFYCADSATGFIWTLWSMSRRGPGSQWRQMVPVIRSDGYVGYTLSLGGCQRRQSHGHRLIAETFLGPPARGQEVRHLDGVRHHNYLSNLVWGTKQENMADKILHGTDARGEKGPAAKLTTPQVLEIRRSAVAGERGCDIAGRLGVSLDSVYSVIHGKTWKCIPLEPAL